MPKIVRLWPPPPRSVFDNAIDQGTLSWGSPPCDRLSLPGPGQRCRTKPTGCELGSSIALSAQGNRIHHWGARKNKGEER